MSQSGCETSGCVVLLGSCDVTWDILKVVKRVVEGKALEVNSLLKSGTVH